MNKLIYKLRGAPITPCNGTSAASSLQTMQHKWNFIFNGEEWMMREFIWDGLDQLKTERE